MLKFSYKAEHGKRRLTLFGILALIILLFLSLIPVKFLYSKALLAYDLYQFHNQFNDYIALPEDNPALTDLVGEFETYVMLRKIMHSTLLLQSYKPSMQAQLDAIYTQIRQHPISAETQAVLDVYYTTYGNCCVKRQSRQPMIDALANLSRKEQFTNDAFLDNYRYTLAALILKENTYAVAHTPVWIERAYWLTPIAYAVGGVKFLRLAAEQRLKAPFSDGYHFLKYSEPLYMDLAENYGPETYQKLLQLRLGHQIYLAEVLLPIYSYIDEREWNDKECKSTGGRLVINYVSDLRAFNDSIAEYSYIKKNLRELNYYTNKFKDSFRYKKAKHCKLNEE